MTIERTAKYFVISNIPLMGLVIILIILSAMNNPWQHCSICFQDAIKRELHDIFEATLVLEMFLAIPTAILNNIYMETG